MEVETRYWVVVTDGDGEFLFRIQDDGSIEYGPHYTPEKARAVWEATYLPGVTAFPEVVDQQEHGEQSKNENDGHDTSPAVYRARR